MISEVLLKQHFGRLVSFEMGLVRKFGGCLSFEFGENHESVWAGWRRFGGD